MRYVQFWWYLHLWHRTMRSISIGTYLNELHFWTSARNRRWRHPALNHSKNNYFWCTYETLSVNQQYEETFLKCAQLKHGTIFFLRTIVRKWNYQVIWLWQNTSIIIIECFYLQIIFFFFCSLFDFIYFIAHIQVHFLSWWFYSKRFIWR